MDFFGPFEARICVENLLECPLGPDVSIVVKIDEAEAVEETRVLPIFTVERVVLLIGRKSLAVVLQEKVHVTQLAVNLGIDATGLNWISPIVVVIL